MTAEKIIEDHIANVISHLNDARHELTLLSIFLFDCPDYYTPIKENIRASIDKINECIQSAVELQRR